MRRAVLPSLLLLSLLVVGPALAADPGPRFRQATSGELGVLATESPAAARVGRAVLERGGNAVDAAAATVFAVGVARPQSCGIGGGGFMVLRERDGTTRALDFRETAPAAMRADTFAGPGLHRQFTGHLTVGVPGTVAGMAAALRRHGTLSLRQAIAPAEALARKGFRVPASLSKAMADNARRLALFPAARAQFLRSDGTAHPAGTLLRQPEHAATLRRLMREGPRAMYGGTIARRIVRDMRAPRPQTGDRGLVTVADFARYRAVWRDPVRGTFRGREIVGMPPPTSGGIAVIEMLHLLQALGIDRFGAQSADAVHLLAEVQKLAFADRARYVADPDFVRVPTASLTSALYAGARSRDIDRQRASTYGPGLEPPTRAEESTTHISVVDARGNAVAVTCTIEQEFGSAVVAPGTGFLLNNELTDFGAPGTANAAEPFKRPRSSMAPTIVVEPTGRPSMVLGAAGGARIIMGVLQPIVQYAAFGQPLDLALDAPRIEAGGARLLIEDRRFAPDVLAELRRRGHVLEGEGEYALRPRVNAAGIAPGGPGLDPSRTDRRVAVADPRTDDGALAQRRRR